MTTPWFATRTSVRGWLLVLAALVAVISTYLSFGRADIQVDGPVVRQETGWWPSGGGSDANIGGQLEYIDGCLLIDGRAVVWPDGTEWDEEHQLVRLGTGAFGETSEIIPKGGSNPGDTVSGGGGVHGEMPGDDAWQKSEAGLAVADCLGPGGALVFNADSDLEVTRAFQ